MREGGRERGRKGGRRKERKRESTRKLTEQNRDQLTSSGECGLSGVMLQYCVCNHESEGGGKGGGQGQDALPDTAIWRARCTDTGGSGSYPVGENIVYTLRGPALFALEHLGESRNKRPTETAIRSEARAPTHKTNISIVRTRLPPPQRSLSQTFETSTRTWVYRTRSASPSNTTHTTAASLSRFLERRETSTMLACPKPSLN